MLVEIYWLISTLIQIYLWVVIAMVVASWLLAFNVLNPRNQFVAMLIRFLHALTEPVLRPIRRILPNLGGIDLSPLVLVLALIFLERILFRLFFGTLWPL